MNGMPPYGPPYGPHAGPPYGPPARDKWVLPVVIIAVCTAAAVALAVIFFTGVVRFGTPRVSGLTMASKIDVRRRPVEKKARFSGSEQRIYCCARVRAFEDTVIEARWYLGSSQVGGYSARYGSLTQTSTGKFITAGGDVAFFLDRPPDGWLGGDYQVRVYLDAKRAVKAGFSIKQREDGSGLSTYQDPAGVFSVGVPYGWAAADESTLDGALAGFLGQGGDYPPRFVVVSTDYTSVDPAYLNGTLSQDGTTAPGEQFQAYSLGESPGARREFEWDYKSGEETFKLRSVQVVVQAKDGKVYGLNCHSKAEDFKSNLPVFNSIINSFRQ